MRHDSSRVKDKTKCNNTRSKMRRKCRGVCLIIREGYLELHFQVL